MKKLTKFMALCVLTVLFIPLSAQTGTFKQGEKVINLGVGLGNTLYGTFGAYYNSSMPALFISGDYCLREDLGPGNLGVGAIMAYSSFKYEYLTESKRYSTFYVAARGTYHFDELVDKLDLYGGVSIGFRIGEYLSSSPIYPGIFVGARYYLSNNIAGMAELGDDIAWLKLGVSLKF
jgi:hypothetical protein